MRWRASLAPRTRARTGPIASRRLHDDVHVRLPHLGEQTAQPSRHVCVLLLHRLPVRGLAGEWKRAEGTPHTKSKTLPRQAVATHAHARLGRRGVPDGPGRQVHEQSSTRSRVEQETRAAEVAGRRRLVHHLMRHGAMLVCTAPHTEKRPDSVVSACGTKACRQACFRARKPR